MIPLFGILCLIVNVLGMEELSLSDKRKACKTGEITIMPSDQDYHEVPIELLFDSSMDFNHVLVTRILAEECDLADRDSKPFIRRKKRSHISRGIFQLSKWFLRFYEQSKRILKPELLKGIKSLVDRLNQMKTPVGKIKYGAVGKFFYEMWNDVEKVKKEVNDVNFGSMIEQTFRTSLQMLIHNGEISDIILNYPSIRDKLQRYIPTSNSKLLSKVTALNVECHHLGRDSQVVLFLKLQIPKIEKVQIEKCDDVGIVIDGTYQYYTFPTVTFSRNGSTFEVDMEKCVFEDFFFCPRDSIKLTSCSVIDIKECALKTEIERNNFVRELQLGYAVFGDFTQIISEKNGLNDQWKVDPRHFFHVIPQSGATILIGSNELKQETDFENTVIKDMEQ